MSSNISLIDEFEFCEKLIQSHFSETGKYKHKLNNSYYIIKKYSNEHFFSSENEIDFQREKSILFVISKKNNPNFAKLINIFEDNSYRYLLFEYFDGQNLETYLSSNNNIDEKVIIHILKEMLKILSFLHNECYVMHRNIKPNNIIIDKNNNIKLIGFNLAAYMKNKNKLLVSRNSFKGQLKYVAPEILFSNKSGSYDTKCDLFSLGYTIYYLMNKELPTETKPMNSFYERINKPPKNNNYSQWLVKFVESLYCTDPIKRPSASEALKILENNLNNNKNI